MEDLSGPSSVPPWGRLSVADGDSRSVQMGPLVIRTRAPNDEIWLAHTAGGNRDSASGGVPEPDEWIRWPVPAGTDAIFLSPTLPPRPVVVEPELAFRLLPAATARIFVRVPLWVRIGVGAGGRTTLVELPSVTLSDTWWGGFTEGELCYWLATSARRRVEPDAFVPHLAVCPLQLSNRSREELEVERIALRVAHLSLFEDRGRLWADETRILYRGDDEGSEIDVSGTAPAEAPEAVRIAEPREPLPRGFRARTFARLKALPGLVSS